MTDNQEYYDMFSTWVDFLGGSTADGLDKVIEEVRNDVAVSTVWMLAHYRKDRTLDEFWLFRTAGAAINYTEDFVTPSGHRWVLSKVDVDD